MLPGKVALVAAEARKLRMHRRSRSGKDKPAQKRFDIPVLRLSWAHFAAKNVTKSAGFASASGYLGRRPPLPKNEGTTKNMDSG